MAGEDTYGDPTGGFPPDLASLQYPWSAPPPPPQFVPTAPGTGIPAAALDAAAPPVEAGPPTAEQAAAQGMLQPTLAPDAASGAPPPPDASAPPPLPYGQAPVAGPPPAPGGPLPPDALGPQQPTVADLTNITTEQPITDAQRAAVDPLRTEPGAEGSVGQLEATPAYSDETAQAALARMAVNNPAAYDAYKAKWQAARDEELATKTLAAATANKVKAQQNADAYNKAYADAQAKSVQLEADWKQLASQKIDPGHWWATRTTGQKIAGVLAAVIGGLYQGRTGGARNMGMDMIQKSIDEDVAAQQANLQNSRSILGARQSAVGEMFARTGDMYHSAEAARAAGWEATIQELQAQRNQLDPRGRGFFLATDALRDAYSRQAAGQQAYQKQQFTNGVEAYKLTQKDREIAETERKNRTDEAEKLLLKKGGAGGGLGAGGSPAGTGYQVGTGLFNPFMHPDEPGAQIMGKRQIGGKGEDPKERKGVQDMLDVYAGVNDYYGKLAAIGRQIDNAKSLGETVWSARKSTLGAEYDNAREALMVYLTKQLGDKLTQGQLEAQQHRIPERKGVFEARDPAKQIQDALADADRDFSRSVSIVGVDADPVIKVAQRQRQFVQASPEQELDAAQQAVATQPDNKDARAALGAAEQRERDEVAAQQKRAADTAAVRELQPPPPLLPENTGASTDELAAVRAANRAATKYTELTKKFWGELGRTDYRQGLKPGQRAAADTAQDRTVGELARQVLDAREFAEAQRGKALQFDVARRGEATGIGADEARTRAKLGLPIGDEQQQPSAPAPNPLAPNASYLPGADPFAPPVNASYLPGPPATAPHKKGKH